MRRLLLLTLTAGLVACGSSTGPDGSVLSVRLRDDSGAPAGRNQVIVTLESDARLNASTGRDGVAEIAVGDAGAYRVTVIPRAGFVGSTALTRTVTVSENTRLVVEFTLHREGISSFPPPLGEY